MVPSGSGAIPTRAGGSVLRVFLSHTSELRALPADRSFVAAAEAAVIRSGHAITDMAYFAAQDTAPAQYCVARVSEAHAYVGLIGHRYGSPVAGRPDVSYTELEFETASRLGLPRLIFLVRDDGRSHASDESEEHAARQERFRRRLLDDGELTIAWVSTPTELELALLHALVQLPSTPEATATPTRALPRDVAAFTGRKAELAQLLAALSDAASSGRAVAVGAIDGMAGVGKTAFVVHAAHRLAPEFPDGQLFLDLHGHTAGQRPVAPADALRGLLLTTGVAMQAVPYDLDSRAAMWRDRLAGKRMLIVLDDAADHEQVRPLLPGAPGCVVLITSRRRLVALEHSHPLTLGTLPPAQAAELFARLTGVPAGGEDRPAMIDLLERCGHLPLAIGLMAGRLRSRPAWTVRHLVHRLEEAQDRFAELKAENVAVDAAFELSYRDLPSEQQRLFRRLGLHPGRETDAYAAAALDGIARSEARLRLDALYDAHLIDEPLPGRYRLHDLIRDYARLLAARDDEAGNEEALDRLLDYYVHATLVAGLHVPSHGTAPPPPRPSPGMELPDLSVQRPALEWLERERANLAACAVMHGRPAATMPLARAVHSYLCLAGHWDQAIAIHQAAVTVARANGDRRGEAGALHDLGVAQLLSCDYPAAETSLTRALMLFRDGRDGLGQARAVRDRAELQQLDGDYESAEASLNEALSLFRDFGDRIGQAAALNRLGIVRYMADEYEAAAASLAEALTIYRDVGHRLGLANVLTNSGVVHRLRGDYPAAVASVMEALTLYRHLDDRFGQAEALGQLGRLRQLIGRYPAAIAAYSDALALFGDLGSRRGRANILAPLASAQSLLGDHLAAVASLTEALAINSELGSRLGRANVLVRLGSVQCVTGERRVGMASLGEAVALHKALGDRLGEAYARNTLGARLLEAGHAGEAVTHHLEALRLARQILSPLEEARALEGMGRCLPEAGRPHLQQALAIYRRIGAAEAAHVAATLDEPAR